MKTLNRLAILFLAFLMSFSSFAGCNLLNNDSNSNDNGNKNNQATFAETENYIIKDSKSDYKVVIADQSRGYESYARYMCRGDWGCLFIRSRGDGARRWFSGG